MCEDNGDERGRAEGASEGASIENGLGKNAEKRGVRACSAEESSMATPMEARSCLHNEDEKATSCRTIPHLTVHVSVEIHWNASHLFRQCSTREGYTSPTESQSLVPNEWPTYKDVWCSPPNTCPSSRTNSCLILWPHALLPLPLVSCTLAPHFGVCILSPSSVLTV